MERTRFRRYLTSLAAGLNALADGFGYSFSPFRIRSINIAAHRKESACYTSFGIFSLD